MIITILTDSPTITTGYRDQAIKLVKHFRSKGHEVHWLANGHCGKTIDYMKLEDGTEIDCKIYGRINHQYFADILSQHLKKTKTDVFLVILDTFMLHGDPKNPQNGWIFQIDTAPAKCVFWYPSDGGGGMPYGCDLVLKRMDLAVAYSKFAQKQVKDYYGMDTPYIPLGTESERFYKLPEVDREKLKESWNLNGKFVIGSVFRNQPRKFPARMIKTMMEFKKISQEIPNSILLLHTDPADVAAPTNLGNLIKRYGLENRVLFTGMNAYNSFDWNKMNDVYNLMDVFYLSTSGEGWGIPLVEAMSCEVPVVCTDYTTTREIVVNNKAGYGIKLVGCEEVDMFSMDMKEYDELVSNGTFAGSWEVERGIIDIKDASKKLKELALNPELRAEMGKNGRKAVLEKYDQKIVNKQWEESLLKLCQ